MLSEKDQRHTEHGVELHGDQIQTTKWTFKIMVRSPLCMIEVWFCAERVQHTDHTPDNHTDIKKG